MRGRSLRANVSWTFASTVVYGACQWGMLVALARLGSPDMIGQFTLAFAVTTPIVSLANLQLRNVQATDAASRYAFADYLGLRLVTVVVSLVAIATIAVTSGYRARLATVVLIVGVAKSFEAVGDILYGFLQRHEWMDRVGASVILRGVLSLIAVGSAVYLTHSVLWGVAALAVVWGAMLAGYDARSARVLATVLRQSDGMPTALRPRWHGATVRTLFWRALPLGLVSGLLSLNASIPPYVISHYLGGYDLGIFAAVASFERVQLIVVNAVGTAVSPRLARLYAGGDVVAFWTLLLKMVLLGAALGAGGILVALGGGAYLLRLVYGPAYVRPELFLGLMVAVAIGNVGWILGYAMTAAGYFRVQLPLFLLITCIVAGASVTLVPVIGLGGAVAAMGLGVTVQTLGGVAVIAHALRARLRHAGTQGAAR
jgi:O-antigen/teichoic acid export membrane protein